MKRMVLTGFVLLCAATPALGQSSAWTFELGAGGAAPTSDLSGRLTAGWDVDAGVGYRFTDWFTVMGEFGVAGFGVPQSILDQAQAPDGHGHIYSINVEPQVRFPVTKRFSGFVEGGVGWLRRTVAFTTPGVQQFDYFDPIYGDIPTDISTDIELSSTTRNAIGGNVGGGVALPLADTGAELFVDVRYYYGPTTPRVTAMIPVAFGIRYTPRR